MAGESGLPIGYGEDRRNHGAEENLIRDMMLQISHEMLQISCLQTSYKLYCQLSRGHVKMFKAR